ncbi:metal-dependent hydrolase [Microbacterium sp. CH12i]|uniref:amidohydrolase n=1 Tax=Microbacterium sp. CH12i TaxID=1479651 RepID=UPI000460F6B2|nr:amidohydrolase family protein [Microbacterium sp. CH12i]KDA05536.1 metal-dependent hydrolase [Microbacterium sp. CH12i]
MTAINDAVGMIREVRIAGPGREYLMDSEPVDILLDGDRIVDIAPTGALRGSGAVLEGHGAWVVPGLWDSHVHTVQWSLASERAQLAHTKSAAEAAAQMSNVAALTDGRRIGTGFRDALWPDAPSIEALDAATGEVPTYLINADVHSVWMNSAALRREGFSTPDGMLREDDAFDISRRLNAVESAHGDRAVAAAGAAAAARGVTGIVDFDMAWNAEAWSRRVAAGFTSQRVEFAVYLRDLARAISEGLRTGQPLRGAHGLIHMGPLKLISDGSLGTRTAACSHPYPGDATDFGVMNLSPADLIDLLAEATGAGLEVAVHAIGDRAVTSALDAVTATGATGTIEHAQLVRHTDIARIARLGLAASVQPQHAIDDRDLVDGFWAVQTAIGYPMASLLRAGVELRLGSDAPVAPLDPWTAIAAAVERTDDERPQWHPQEQLTRDEALSASVRGSIRPGGIADLVLCGADPQAASASMLRRMPVLATLLAGRITHLA